MGSVHSVEGFNAEAFMGRWPSSVLGSLCISLLCGDYYWFDFSVAQRELQKDAFDGLFLGYTAKSQCEEMESFMSLKGN